MGIGEDVKPVLVEQEVSLVLPDRRREGRIGFDDQGIPEGGLPDLSLARRPTHAVEREGLGEVWRIAQLAVTRFMVIRARHDANSPSMGVVGERAEIGDDALAVGHVERTLGPHEVVLGVDVPEERAHQVTRSSRGFGR